MAINLGYVPQRLTVTLVEGGDFATALLAPDDWPDGTEIELRLAGGTNDPVVWPATVQGPRADWDLAAVAVQDVIDARVSRARLVCSTPDGNVLVWAEGPVNAHRSL